MRLARRLVLACLLILCPVTAHAQAELVYDHLNWLLNFITSGNSVLIVSNQLIELLPLDELIAMDGFLESVDEARSALEALRGLGWDIQSVDGQFTRLFRIESLPETSAGMAEWQTETRRLALESRHDAARVQTLVRTLRRTFQHLLGLMQSIANTVGNLQISQTISQAQQKVAQLLSEQQLTRTVHERAETVEAARDVAETEILKKINCGLWKSWPGLACE